MRTKGPHHGEHLGGFVAVEPRRGRAAFAAGVDGSAAGRQARALGRVAQGEDARPRLAPASQPGAVEGVEHGGFGEMAAVLDDVQPECLRGGGLALGGSAVGEQAVGRPEAMGIRGPEHHATAVERETGVAADAFRREPAEAEGRVARGVFAGFEPRAGGVQRRVAEVPEFGVGQSRFHGGGIDAARGHLHGGGTRPDFLVLAPDRHDDGSIVSGPARRDFDRQGDSTRIGVVGDDEVADRHRRTDGQGDAAVQPAEAVGNGDAVLAPRNERVVGGGEIAAGVRDAHGELVGRAGQDGFGEVGAEGSFADEIITDQLAVDVHLRAQPRAGKDRTSRSPGLRSGGRNERYHHDTPW